MFRLKLYYHAKPYLPSNLRMAVRRFFALRKRERHLDTWPIDPSANEPPSRWTGWPDGKTFAFVLSHDVESQIGYDKIEPLIALEESLGFRSVINFIPEGDYKVSEERIQDLKRRGFEVGVHGLFHDGKLYHHRPTFEKRAKRINQYLKKWDARGFRSPLMHHNLDWLHALEIDYDTSTFDTDPFEPQPDGANTIFPFFVEKCPEPVEGLSSNSNSIHDQKSLINNQNTQEDPQSAISNPQSRSSADGYVELPYTLPQDSTLFLLLKETDNRVWNQKLDWIADCGGMAFVNVHPDYIDFDGSGKQATYPVRHYQEFLTQAKSKYENQYWHATPGEVANWFVANR